MNKSISKICQTLNQVSSLTYLALSVTWVMDGVRIETLKLVWGEEDASLMAFYLCKEVLLLVIMCWCHIAWENDNIYSNVKKKENIWGLKTVK